MYKYTMPELPEVQTTVNGLHSVLPELSIQAIWSDYQNKLHATKKHIKSAEYFKKFQKELAGKKFIGVSRRGKNILIELTGGLTILIHMKMTGHVMYGKYKQEKGVWKSVLNGALADPFNQFIHLVFTLSNGFHLVLSDVRKFAKVLIIKTADLAKHPDLSALGREPLDTTFSFSIFQSQILKRPNWKIKSALLDQTLIAGIGNIYSDEILWLGDVHPLSITAKIPEKNMHAMWNATKNVLKKSIGMGGDSLSDYRNAFGEKGGFQLCHNAYRQTGKKCPKKGCGGIIERVKVGGRSAHFCPKHQRKY